MKKYKTLLATTSLAMAGWLALSSTAMAYCALAINSNHGSQYGWATGQANSDDAEATALGYCGAGCSVVMRFASGCGAYAADQADGSSVYGWGTGGSRQQAEATAIGECEGHGGSSCIIRVWACE